MATMRTTYIVVRTVVSPVSTHSLHLFSLILFCRINSPGLVFVCLSVEERSYPKIFVGDDPVVMYVPPRACLRKRKQKVSG